MNPEHVMTIAGAFFRTALYLAGPLLVASLVAGVVVGLVQTATQVNEPSVSFVVKVVALLAVILALGPTLLTQTLEYTRTCFENIATVR